MRKKSTTPGFLLLKEFIPFFSQNYLIGALQLSKSPKFLKARWRFFLALTKRTSESVLVPRLELLPPFQYQQSRNFYVLLKEQLLENQALNLTVHYCCGLEFPSSEHYDQKSFMKKRGLNRCEPTSLHENQA
ncbi:hypothetical protein Tco_1510072 [Tanacetum coccineum]